MKIGDAVMLIRRCKSWDRLGLVLGFQGGYVQVFWGEDFPCEDEYPDQLEVV